MRTKTLFLSAALVAAGVASSMAQSNVYSLNVVGYVNLSLTNGLNLVANPLDFDGTGTNNTVQGVFSTNLPHSSTVYLFNPADGSFDTILNYTSRGVWSGNAPLNPGTGAFVLIPSPVTITCVGTVLQGTNLVNTNLAPAGGLSLLGSVAPISGTIDGTTNGLMYVPTHGDTVYEWDPVGQGYVIYPYSSRGVWTAGDPVVAVGQGFFLSTAGTNWTENFTVQ